MSATIVRPPVTKTSFFPEKQIYLVYNQKVPYTCRANDRTSLVIFPEISHAHKISQILETHYSIHKEWPDISDTTLSLNFKNTRKELTYIDIIPIDPFEIFHMCLKLNLSACIVDNIEESENQFKVICNVIDIFPSTDDFKATLENIYLV